MPDSVSHNPHQSPPRIDRIVSEKDQKILDTLKKNREESAFSRKLNGESHNLSLSQFDNWIQIMIASLKYQDPMDPMKPAELAAQMAQFGSVFALTEMNKKFDYMVEGQNNAQILEAASQIDRLVEVVGDTIHFDPNGAPMAVAYTLPHAVGASRLVVTNHNKQIVAITQGETEKGEHVFRWNGKDNNGDVLPKGNYTVSINVFDSNHNLMMGDDKKPIIIPTTIIGPVTGGTRKDGKAAVVMGGSGGVSFPLESVVAIQTQTLYGDPAHGQTAPLNDVFNAHLREDDLKDLPPLVTVMDE